ncbi:MAG TPA: DEAD/DEAH box helicase family protein [Candidatus Aphodousia faecipullorum]|nr:DEAD/DEAH box helicase family protein [Candidatus Aphodousia faecipullorum]
MTTEEFFQSPILNSPYEEPTKHWKMSDGVATGEIIEERRRADFVTPIPKAKTIEQSRQAELEGISDSFTQDGQKYTKDIINEIRSYVKEWRKLPKELWGVTPETARLLEHWRNHKFLGIRPFFCQLEAVEVAIWLTEVAPNQKVGVKILNYLKTANDEANSGLPRIALKLATGAGKTTVMAMLIAWQTINAVKQINRKKFTKGFVVVAPGITIRDRLRVLLPNDPDSYYQKRELVPVDMLPAMQQARVVVTNYHAFKLRQRFDVSKGTRAAIEGWRGESLNSLETEGEMLQRVMPELMNLQRVMIFNDEAHHCYQEKENDVDEAFKNLSGEDKKEAKKEAEENREAARVWINGLKIISKHFELLRVFDLSATPFFLSGSGYIEGTIFPWTMSDFSLMDAIECGIVKLPRVPVEDNDTASVNALKYRDLWSHIRDSMPKKSRGVEGLDPRKLPPLLCAALDALYKHYKEVFELWQKAGISVPPCFIVVCNNTQTSKLLYDYISGGDGKYWHGHFELFRNYDSDGNPLSRPRTILVDSKQLESGEGLDASFKKVAQAEIDIFKREILQRGGVLADQIRQGKEIDDATLLREVMNTVGKKGHLGESVRCVVSVSMLAEGWDANTVTHVMGIRAFGTQLLCEQVIGRALRRQSYELNEQGLFAAEYADVLGIPFDFTAKPVPAKPAKPREVIAVHAISPDRDNVEIVYPRVRGYRAEFPKDRLTAKFTPDSEFVLTKEEVGPSITINAGIIGETNKLTTEDLSEIRTNTIAMHLASYLLAHLTKQGEEPPLHLFGQMNRIAKEWLQNYLICRPGTYEGQVLYQVIADRACQRIIDAISRSQEESQYKVKVLLDPYNKTGSTRSVNFTTTKIKRFKTGEKCHVNYAILDSDWEGTFCKIVENHPKVISYVKNQGLGFEVPYRVGTESRIYIPDFIVQVDDGPGKDDPLNLIIEIKGYRGEDVKDKSSTMQTYWVPGVNALKEYGRWAFAELQREETMEADFEAAIEGKVNELINKFAE